MDFRFLSGIKSLHFDPVFSNCFNYMKKRQSTVFLEFQRSLRASFFSLQSQDEILNYKVIYFCLFVQLSGGYFFNGYIFLGCSICDVDFKKVMANL